MRPAEEEVPRPRTMQEGGVLMTEQHSVMENLHQEDEGYRVHKRAKSLQSCPTLCDPMDRSPPGSSVHGILQAGILEWGAIAFSRQQEQPVHKQEHSPSEDSWEAGAQACL